MDYVIERMPVYEGLAQIDGIVRNFNLTEGRTPETSGGLLISLPSQNASAFIEELKGRGEFAEIVGYVEEGTNTARMSADLRIVEV